MATPKALLMTPGAGSDRTQSTLLAVEAALPKLTVERIDFPYRGAGRRAPDRAPVLIECVRQEAAALVARAHCRPSALLLGGRSMGGRMCSMAVAEGLSAAGLVLISYPLHPPGAPHKLRTAHLGAIDVPVLFVHGTKDPFGAPEELQAAAALIKGAVTHVWIEGGRHDLKGADAAVAAAVANWVRGLGPVRRPQG